MKFSLFIEYGPMLLQGLLFTLYVCAGALLIGVLCGLALCLLGSRNWLPGQLFYRFYVGLFRGTPLLVQLFLVFYGGPLVGIELSEFQVGIGGLGLYSAAYFAEIFRAGFAGVPPGQVEAALDLGFSPWQVLCHVRLPQMFARVMPALINQSILLVKESAVLSVITVPEMTNSAIRMSTESFSVIEPYLFLGVTYWLITFALSRAAARLERRLTPTAR